jgi:ribosomal protein S18 acetylase RimI-like enzyme
LFTGEKLSAFIVVNEIQHFMYETISWKYSRPLVIHRLTVHPEHHGKGYAKELVAFAEKIAEENQYDSIRLDAFIPNHAAVCLYESGGYERRGVIRFRKGDFYAMEKLI